MRSTMNAVERALDPRDRGGNGEYVRLPRRALIELYRAWQTGEEQLRRIHGEKFKEQHAWRRSLDSSKTSSSTSKSGTERLLRKNRPTTTIPSSTDDRRKLRLPRRGDSGGASGPDYL